MQIFNKAHLQMPMSYSQGVGKLTNGLDDMIKSGSDVSYSEGDSEFSIIDGVNTPEVLRMLVDEGFLTDEEAVKVLVMNVLELTFYR